MDNEIEKQPIYVDIESNGLDEAASNEIEVRVGEARVVVIGTMEERTTIKKINEIFQSGGLASITTAFQSITNAVNNTTTAFEAYAGAQMELLRDCTYFLDEPVKKYRRVPQKPNQRKLRKRKR